MNSGLVSLLWFGAILALIPLALWLLKRTPLGGAAAGHMRVVAALPLAPNQRLLTVEVGSGAAKRWLVLGVTAQQITTLHTMDAQADAPAPSALQAAHPATPFAQLMGRLTGKAQEDGRGH